MANNITENINEWLKLSNQGLFIEAKNFYFNYLFDEIIDRFVDKTSSTYTCDVLFSILGFTPEPIILTQRALAPKAHVIFTTSKDYESDNEIISYLEKYLTSSYKIVNLNDDSFETIYKNLKAQMNLYPSSKFVIDITGGKKSMVASAAIFARDFNCNVVYVDYDEYLSELRRPMPGTEKLNIVYSMNDDFVNTIDFVSLDTNKNVNKNVSPTSPNKNKKSNTNKQKTGVTKNVDPMQLGDSNYQKLFIDAFSHYVGEDTISSKNWLPRGIDLIIKSDRIFMLRDKMTYVSITIQRAQLFDFFCKCKRNNASASRFIGGSSVQAKKLNPAIHSLLNAINYELFEERFK